jgi:hypothetical protein
LISSRRSEGGGREEGKKEGGKEGRKEGRKEERKDMLFISHPDTVLAAQMD